MSSRNSTENLARNVRIATEAGTTSQGSISLAAGEAEDFDPYLRGGDLPQIRKTLEYGGSRFSIVNDIMQKYTRCKAQFKIESPVPDEVTRLQWLLNHHLKGIENAQYSENWREMAKPRSSITELKDELDDLISDNDTDWQRNADSINKIDNYIRNMALKKLECDTFRELQIIYNSHVAEMPDFHDEMPPFSPFSWTIDDFLRRRDERNTVWIDALLTLSEKDLEMLKFKCDIEELFTFLRWFFEALQSSTGEAKQNLFEFVVNAYEYLNFPEILKSEAKDSMRKLRVQVNSYVDMMHFKRGPEAKAYKLFFEQKLVDISTIGPIELRYEVNWMNIKTDQTIMKITNALDSLKKKAKDYQIEESREKYCVQKALDMYYMDIEKYKKKIAELTLQYDTELEKAENEITYKKLTLDKLREQRKFLEEQMIRFEQESNELRQKEMDELIAAEEAKRLAELAAQQKAQKGKKNGRGKAKDKNKGKKK